MDCTGFNSKTIVSKFYDFRWRTKKMLTYPTDRIEEKKREKTLCTHFIFCVEKSSTKNSFTYIKVSV